MENAEKTAEMNTVEETTEKTLNLSRRVTIRNTTNIDTYFRYALKDADAKVAKKARLSISVEELIAQADNANPDFVGYGRDGRHATFYIEDKEMRVYLGFETDDGKVKQEVNDEQAIIDMFEAANLTTFVTLLKTKVVTPGEKQTLRDVIASEKVNAHDKIGIATAYLRGEPIEAPKGKPGRPSNKNK